VVAVKSQIGAILLSLGLGAGCHGCGQKGIGENPTPTPTASATAVPLPPARVITDLIEQLPHCDVEHRGVLFDVSCFSSMFVRCSCICDGPATSSPHVMWQV